MKKQILALLTLATSNLVIGAGDMEAVLNALNNNKAYIIDFVEAALPILMDSSQKTKKIASLITNGDGEQLAALLEANKDTLNKNMSNIIDLFAANTGSIKNVINYILNEKLPSDLPPSIITSANFLKNNLNELDIIARLLVSNKASLMLTSNHIEAAKKSVNASLVSGIKEVQKAIEPLINTLQKIKPAKIQDGLQELKEFGTLDFDLENFLPALAQLKDFISGSLLSLETTVELALTFDVGNRMPIELVLMLNQLRAHLVITQSSFKEVLLGAKASLKGLSPADQKTITELENKKADALGDLRAAEIRAEEANIHAESAASALMKKYEEQASPEEIELFERAYQEAEQKAEEANKQHMNAIEGAYK